MEPTTLECMMLVLLVIGTIIGLCALALKAEEEKNGRF